MPLATEWPPVTFKPVRYRRRSQLRGGIGAVAFGIFAIALASSHAKDRAALIALGVILIMIGVAFLVGQRGQTTIDGEGLSASSPFGRRSCRWSEVDGIRLDINDRGEDPVLSTIKIDLHGGRTFTLAVPRDH
jgi:Bacterial PH domain